MKDKYLHVPYYILTDNNLDSTKKILLSAIKSLSVLEKGCYASNEYFGEILSINSAGASKQISKLKKLGYIETKTFYVASKERRKIKVVFEFWASDHSLFFAVVFCVIFDCRGHLVDFIFSTIRARRKPCNQIAI